MPLSKLSHRRLPSSEWSQLLRQTSSSNSDKELAMEETYLHQELSLFVSRPQRQTSKVQSTSAPTTASRWSNHAIKPLTTPSVTSVITMPSSPGSPSPALSQSQDVRTSPTGSGPVMTHPSPSRISGCEAEPTSRATRTQLDTLRASGELWTPAGELDYLMVK